MCFISWGYPRSKTLRRTKGRHPTWLEEKLSFRTVSKSGSNGVLVPPKVFFQRCVGCLLRFFSRRDLRGVGIPKTRGDLTPTRVFVSGSICCSAWRNCQGGKWPNGEHYEGKSTVAIWMNIGVVRHSHILRRIFCWLDGYRFQLFFLWNYLGISQDNVLTAPVFVFFGSA